MPDEPIRLIATDVDGTLMNSHGVIPERNIRAIKKAREMGVQVAISSGRFPENVYILLEDYGLRCPIIGVNGAKVVDENLRTLSERLMKTEAAEAVLNVLLDMGADFFIFGVQSICVSRPDGVHHSELSQGERIAALGFTYYRGPEEAKKFVRRGVHKFYICDTKPLPPIRERLRQVPGIDLTQSGTYNIEVMPAGVDKAQGVRDLAKALGIPMAQVMTLGDEGNDIPMLRAAGYGVAMGNGSLEAKAAARFITDTNDQCGFAKAVEQFALK